MQFKVGNYQDGDRKSNIRALTGVIKADWIQLPVERYLAVLPALRHGVIAGVFRNKGAAPWGITTVGGLGSEGDKTVLLGHKNWNPISSSKCTVLARHG